MTIRRLGAAAIAAFAVVFSAALQAAAAGFHVERLTDDLHIPVYATTAPGDDNRIFIAQIGGVASDGRRHPQRQTGQRLAAGTQRLHPFRRLSRQ